MKYKKEIKQLWREVIFGDDSKWFTEKEIDEILDSELPTELLQELTDEIEAGVRDGHTVDEQLKFVKTVFEQIKKKL